MPKSIKNRAKGGPIKWPALNLTLYSGAVLSVGAILTWWHKAFKALFGYNPQDHPGAAAAIFVALVAAVALIFAADLLTRGIASSRPGDSAPLPEGLKATIVKDGPDEEGLSAVSVRIASGGVEVLVLKQGTAPAWHQLGSKNEQVKLSPAA